MIAEFIRAQLGSCLERVFSVVKILFERATAWLELSSTEQKDVVKKMATERLVEKLRLFGGRFSENETRSTFRDLGKSGRAKPIGIG